MTESDVDVLFAEVESVVQSIFFVKNMFRNTSLIKRAYAKSVDAGASYIKCECHEKAAYSYNTAGSLAKILGLYEFSAKYFELAGRCLGRYNLKVSMFNYDCAFEIYTIINDMDGLERCSEFILQKLDSSELSRSFSSKYYDKGLEELVKYAQKHGIPKLMTKLKYKYLKYLFKEKGIKQALTFYDDVIRKSISWDQFGDWVELRCVCVCILAILRREGIVQISNDDVSKSPQDVENNFQNLSVQRFWECLKKRNIDGLEETVKRLSAKSEDPEAFIEDPVLEHVVEDPCKEQLNQDSGTEQVVKDPVIKLPSY